MNSFGITGYEQILIGLYLIAHGLIHLIFLIYVKDEKTNNYTGWSRSSWLLDKILSRQFTKITGFITWIVIAILFVISGLGILDILPLNELLSPILIIVSILAIGGYIVFFNGLSPTPYHWILGIVIDLLILCFIGFFSDNALLFLLLLLIVWLYGMVFHTRVLSFTLKENTTI